MTTKYHPLSSIFDHSPAQSSDCLTLSTQQASETDQNMKSILSSLWEEALTAGQSFNIQRIDAGSVVATAHQLSENVYVLSSGRVNFVCRSPHTKRQLVITTLEPGAFFGHGALHELGSSNKFAVAAEDAIVWTMRGSNARAVMAQHPMLSLALLQTSVARLDQLQARLEALAHKTLPERLAQLLLELSEIHGNEIVGFSHQMLAEYLGTYRETVSTILRDFKRERMITLGYRQLNVVDANRLAETAGLLW